MIIKPNLARVRSQETDQMLDEDALAGARWATEMRPITNATIMAVVILGFENSLPTRLFRLSLSLVCAAAHRSKDSDRAPEGY